MMREYKLLFTGPVGAGKTTAIASISEVAPVVTDVRNTDSYVSKSYTTVGFDYGLLTLDDGVRLRLFGTPGQERFDFLWSILANKALGLIVLLDNTRADPIGDLALYLRGFEQQLGQLPCVIGVGRMTQDTGLQLDDYSQFLSEQGMVLPVLPVDVRKKDDVALLIDVLMAQMEGFLLMEGH